jgi:hypothetical protein
MYWRLDCSQDWQVIALALLFAVITTGNLITTGMVVFRKFLETDPTQLVSKYRPKAM